MWTISRLARKFGLSRSTLLYYDSIGLLSPSQRSSKGYRYYTDKEEDRLEQICLYRSLGLKLQDIKALVEKREGRVARVLEQRLEELDLEVSILREQQRMILRLLQNPELEKRVGPLNKEAWIDLLTASGFSDGDMHRWHREFERRSPDKHQKFLEFLAIPSEEISAIRRWSLKP